MTRPWLIPFWSKSSAARWWRAAIVARSRWSMQTARGLLRSAMSPRGAIRARRKRAAMRRALANPQAFRGRADTRRRHAVAAASQLLRQACRLPVRRQRHGRGFAHLLRALAPGAARGPGGAGGTLRRRDRRAGCRDRRLLGTGIRAASGGPRPALPAPCAPAGAL